MLLSFIFLVIIVGFCLFSRKGPLKDTKLGRWSLISLSNILLSRLPCQFLLMKVLSIRVAVLLVICVGLVMQGNRFNSRLDSMKCWVSLWLWDLRKSRLWSRPSIISQHFISFSFLTNCSYSWQNVFKGVFGGLYTDTSRIFLFLHFNSITWCSKHMDSIHRSGLSWVVKFFFMRKPTPPPFFLQHSFPINLWP